jgi:hypothetical protein
MTSSCLYDEGSRVLTAGAFKFVLNIELQRAERAQDFVTLVTIEVEREWSGTTFPADKGTMHGVAEVIGSEVRSTDLMGHAGERTLALMLVGGNVHQFTPLIDRLVLRIKNHAFDFALRMTVGAACCPTDGLDADSLRCSALSRPIVNLRGRGPTGSLTSG